MRDRFCRELFSTFCQVIAPPFGNPDARLRRRNGGPDRTTTVVVWPICRHNAWFKAGQNRATHFITRAVGPIQDVHRDDAVAQYQIGVKAISLTITTPGAMNAEVPIRNVKVDDALEAWIKTEEQPPFEVPVLEVVVVALHQPEILARA